MGTTSTSLFSGNSRYAQDFQAVIDRTVAIASLPISQLNKEKTKLTDQSTALDAIADKFSSLQTAVSSLSSAMAGATFDAAVSDATVVSAAVGNGALEGTYAVEVTDIGAYATSMSSSNWSTAAEPDGGKTTYELVIGTDVFNVTPNDNSAATVAGAINSKAGDKVRATVVNVGSSTTPDYRISLQSVKLGPIALSIRRDSVDQQAPQTVGRVAKYIVNGSGLVVDATSRSVEIANGVNVTLLASKAGTPVNITVSRSTSAVSEALSAFATAYNETLDSIDGHRGNAGGALSGESVVYDLSSALSSLATYSSDGTMSGLESLGLTLENNGKLTFNQFNFLAADLTNATGVSSFLGSAGGGGFLKWATDTLDRVANGTSGLIDSASASVTASIESTDSRITESQERIDALKERLQGQIAAADALIASFEQQYAVVFSVFNAMQANSAQYQ